MGRGRITRAMFNPPITRRGKQSIHKLSELYRLSVTLGLSVYLIALRIAVPLPQPNAVVPSVFNDSTITPSAPQPHAKGFARLIAPAPVLSAKALEGVSESIRQTTSN